MSQIVALVELDPSKFIRDAKRFFQLPFINNDPLEVTYKSRWTHPAMRNVPCPICQCIQPSCQQLELHMLTRHKIRNPINMYIDTVWCPVCLMMFHTRECIMNHIRYRAPACRMVLLLRGPVMSLKEAEAVIDSQKAHNRKLYALGKRRYHKDLPAMRAYGPFPLDSQLRDAYFQADKDLRPHIAQHTSSLDPCIPALLNSPVQLASPAHSLGHRCLELNSTGRDESQKKKKQGVKRIKTLYEKHT